MNCFEDYQKRAAATPVALRNDRDRIDHPVLGLQGEAGKIGAVLERAFLSGRLEISPVQREELKTRLARVLWYIAFLCEQTGVTMQEAADVSMRQIEALKDGLGADQR
jgi:hypothetical protein